MHKILGTKLRKVRENMGITQGVLAKGVGLSSEFISLLELGKRMPSLESLTAIAEFVKKDVSYFLLEKETAYDRLFQYEGLGKKARGELIKFKEACEKYIMLEEITQRPMELAPLYSNVSPERMVEEERRRLGLGNEPIRDIFSLIELNGCHIIRQPFAEKSQISGVFIFLEQAESAFVSINSHQSFGSQIFVAAHEYCHYLKDRYIGPIIDNPDIFIDEYISLYHPREKFAQIFAARFLMPPSKVKEIINKDLRSNDLNFEDVLYLKRYFNVGTLEMLRMLKKLECLSHAKCEEFQKLESEAYENALFGDLGESWQIKRNKGKMVYSERFKSLAFNAFRKKKIAGEKLSELLNLDKNTILSVSAKLK